MNMKNTVILLIFLLSILGLLVGVYYSTDVSSDNSPDGTSEKIYEDPNGTITITLENKEPENTLSEFFT